MMLAVFTASTFLFAGAQVSDTLRKINVEGAESMRQFSDATGNVFQTLAGNARIRQGSTYMSADSIIINLQTGIAEGFGNVRINDADTLQTYSQYIKYIGNERLAFLKGNVKLTDGKGILLTEDLVYNLQTGIGTYSGGGRLINGTTVLNSTSAIYYGQTKDVIFKGNVALNDPKYRINSDSLRYNTEYKIANFIAPTKIVSDNGIITTSAGNYNLLTGEANFGGNPEFRDSTRFASGKNINVDEKSGNIFVDGNGKIVDSANKVIIFGEHIKLNKKENTFGATGKPVMVFYENNDSTYISADTLFSATQLLNDSSKTEPDSIRFFKGFRNVKIYNDSAQAVSDSFYYSTLDSAFRMYQNPLFWNGKTQVSGDTMYLFTKNRQPSKLEVFNNSFVINKPEESVYNQISGRTLNAFFIDGAIDNIKVKGTPAQSIFFPQNSDSAYIGMNKNHSDVIDFIFVNKELKKVKYINDVEGTLYPMEQIPTSEKYLKGFLWQDSKRPKSKFDLFL
ncbi:MAG: LPS export ABC transporter periplasmic protein LptC [Bacteroidetes bacterium]|nr:LPS export ABC transporter periplasmic protein LptC [Bacteroidota bacterium]